MRRDIASFLVPNHMPQMWNKKEINNELIMLQQMCQMFGKPYSISFATQYLKKLNINVSETVLKDMYLKEDITFITDYRENRTEEFQKFLKNDL